ncbi:hypothetical protein CWI38_2448p0010 [Hamiltosporidium tvaerminnensis]|uniref:Uncharacterized protein n=1 Tax=Hamiltosporidium tvaerminnensis TaxID=1176355 RepID=A0A4Q9LGB2_9MICR|nr:hypothetical protein CWI38_2448p0010 [Hamiltosporidium tvaerminnensis]
MFLCPKIFSNSNLKPSKLLEHFRSLHGGKGTHSTDNMKSKKARIDSGDTIPKLCELDIRKPLIVAFYQVAYCV